MLPPCQIAFRRRRPPRQHDEIALLNRHHRSKNLLIQITAARWPFADSESHQQSRCRQHILRKEYQMKPILASLTIAALLAAAPAFAEGDLSRANVIDVVIEMGSNDDGMYLKPDNYEFVTGQAYKLILTNVDEIKHELALNEMFERIFTRKVEAADADGNLITEVKGAIREVEVGAGQVVEWFIVPVQTTDGPVEITCEIPGHLEAGMRASAVIN
jgi:uncharacterized cupredoxin-like copper-binding protein